jgi:hypothetical protein
MDFVESLMIYRIDQRTYFAFVLVGIFVLFGHECNYHVSKVLFLLILTFLVVTYPNPNYLVHITPKWNQQLI